MENYEREELILFLLNEIDNTDHIVGINEYRLNKVLFKLEQKLPENHVLKYSIPFYWYFHGPFSDWLRVELKELLNKNLIKKEKYRTYQLFRLVSEKIPDTNIIDSKVERIVSKLLKKETFFKIDRIVYDEDAPYKFMPLYKFNFLDTIKAYKNSIEKGEENSELIEEAIKICYKCESKLPFESYYLEYDELFSEFAVNLDMLNDNEITDIYFNEISKGALETWCTFGYGVRVKHHHHYYNDDALLIEWDGEFKSKLNGLSLLMEKFNEMSVNSSSLEKVNFSETSQNILSSSVGNYLLSDNNGL